MRSIRGIHSRLVDAEHLDDAARAVVRGKRRRRDVALFLFRREEVLDELRRSLMDGSWRPDGFERVYIREPKPRVIARSTVRDRIVHSALVSAMQPAIARSLLPESMACRPGFGTHRAALRLLRGMRRQQWFVHLDVRAYFPSIDLGILRGLLRRRIRDDRFLDILDLVLDAGTGVYDAPEARRWLRLPDATPGRGLPVGAYTSQVLASWLYLDALDHHVKRTLKVPDYVRYVDDLFLFGPERSLVEAWRDEIGWWLFTERRLVLKSPHARVRSTLGHLHGLGQRIGREGIAPLPRAIRRLRGLAAAAAWGGRLERVRFRRSLPSRMGVLLFG